jgi:outer membrane lipoprotein-sorting protein
MKNIFVTCVASLLAVAGSTTAANDRGLEIARQAQQRDSGWKDQQVELSMTLRSAGGAKTVRHLRTRSLEVTGDGDKLLTIFDAPSDVKGTAFLSHTHQRGQDDQWLYLPAIRRVKRISSSNRSGPFMGSEFAYEDLSSEEVERYRYRYLGDKPCGDGWSCFVVARYPVDESSGYTKQVVWIDKAHYRFVKTAYYDRKGAHAKTLTRSRYQKYAGRFWRAARWEMKNHLNGKSTLVEWKRFTFSVGLSERDFDKGALKRAH